MRLRRSSFVLGVATFGLRQMLGPDPGRRNAFLYKERRVDPPQSPGLRSMGFVPERCCSASCRAFRR
jgi:hypothetical protein